MSRPQIRNDDTDGLQKPGIFPRSVVKTNLKLQGPPSPGCIQGRRITVRVRFLDFDPFSERKNLPAPLIFPAKITHNRVQKLINLQAISWGGGLCAHFAH